MSSRVLIFSAMVGEKMLLPLALKLERATDRGMVTTEGSSTSSMAYTMLWACTQQVVTHDQPCTHKTRKCSPLLLPLHAPVGHACASRSATNRASFRTQLCVCTGKKCALPLPHPTTPPPYVCNPGRTSAEKVLSTKGSSTSSTMYTLLSSLRTIVD